MNDDKERSETSSAVVANRSAQRRFWFILLAVIALVALYAAVRVPLKEYDDVRAFARMPARKDISTMDLTGARELIPTLWFNEKTKWPEKMPEGCDPKAILEAAKNPGLGIRALHDQGITGEGVTVAIIDQPLYLDHPEFAGKILEYKDFNCQSESSMHGPAVTSLLVGENCGTAPGAKVYYAAAPSWFGDAKYYADALDWLVSINKELPEGQKIRVVSVSAAPSGQGSPFTKNGESWDRAVADAKKEGILVLDCTDTHGIIAPCWYDSEDPENVQRCMPGFPGRPSAGMGSRYICAPSSPRTSAEEYVEGDYSYQYTGRGGLSWSIPYVAGVLALGWQVDPDLTANEAVALLLKSAYKPDGRTNIIDPPAFVSLVRSRNSK